MSLASLFVLCRFVHFISVMQLFGACVFTRLLSPQGLSALLARKNQTLILTSACLSALTALLMVAVQAGVMGNGWTDMLNVNVWLLVLTTTFGEVWRWHMLMVLVALLLILIDGLPGRFLMAMLLSAGMLIGQALIGHAAMHEGTLGVLQRTNHAVHLLSAAYWFGSLIPLLTCMRLTHQPATRPEAIVALLRFSTLGHAAVALVVLTGIANSAFILQRWPTDIHSPYELLLVCKAALVAVMVAVAIYNRYWLVPQFAHHNEHTQRRMIAVCWLEFALALLVIALVSLFATLSPN
ncbi:copper homeostasis membrane protein CopD [Rouxiella badensis]|uniref:copper homeostasis membrane protein CopD n=1 Tax=Rouxiella badensis TaxID=1646377 RepID=UPI0013EF3D18|nr:copper homeostasis membrane protein CopD [Rouxiella badensis]QII37346.1 copper homeostasis membrane protein CopD [Rouxiella badensis]